VSAGGKSPLHPLERVFGYFLHEQKVTPVRQDKVGGFLPQKYSTTGAPGKDKTLRLAVAKG